jgi:hypothetical protein
LFFSHFLQRFVFLAFFFSSTSPRALVSETLTFFTYNIFLRPTKLRPDLTASFFVLLFFFFELFFLSCVLFLLGPF